MPATKKARRQARLLEKDRETILSFGLRSAPVIVAKIKRDILADWMDDRPMNLSIDAAMTKHLQPMILDAMVAADLQGRLRVILSCGKQLKDKSLRMYSAVGPYKKAVDFLQRRLNLPDEQVGALAETYGNESARVLRAAAPTLEKHAQLATIEIVESGAHANQAKAILRKHLEKGGLDGAKPWLVETISRTQIQVAYGAGRWNENQEPEIQEILWGYEYVTVGDDRVRAEHIGYDGIRLPKDDPQWSAIWPPNGFNCRCSTIEIYNDDDELASVKPPPETVEVDGKTVTPSVDAGWDFNPGQVHQNSIPISK